MGGCSFTVGFHPCIVLWVSWPDRKPDDSRVHANRHRPSVQVLNLVFTKPAAWDTLFLMLKELRILYVHAAPPCGTATKARVRPVPLALRRRGAPEPRPLRSSACPLGLPGLRGVDSAKVMAANAIFLQLEHFLRESDRVGIWFSLENPRGSYMWQIEEFVSFASLPGVHFVTFQHCMHSGKRDKWSAWLTNIHALSALAATCDGKHEHEPWGRPPSV
jgi:hypothetical protein